MGDEFANFLVESILEHSPVAVLATDENGIMIFANKEASELFGYAKDELIGQEVEILLPNAIRNKHRAMRAEYMKSDPEPRRMGFGRDLFGMEKNGNLIPIEIGLNPISILDKTYVVATIINITERKRQQDRQLNQLIKNLERSNKELEEYASVISHDLQNPLSVILSYSELLEKELRGEQQDLISKIRASVARMSQLTSNLLELSRVVKQQAQFKEVDLNLLIQAVMGEIKVLLEQTEAKVKVEPLAKIEADPVLLAELFQNLLSNASKYRKPDVAPVIHVRGHLDGEFYVIEVADNGMGMADTKQIFQIFHRLSKSEKSVSGHGVGLAVCKKIIDLHHGELMVQSKEGVGTTFTVRLPIKQLKA